MFDPEALRVLQAAFDLTIAELHARGVGIDDHLARGLIAKRIVEAARLGGEGDTDRLKRYALQAFEI